MKSKLLFIALLLIPIFGFSQIFEENFDDFINLEDNGWLKINLSEPLGPIDWFPGNTAAFNSHSGAPDAYIAAGHENTSASGGIISNWLITPNVVVKDGDVVSFWTRVPEGSTWNDRLEVRSSLGAMTAPSESAEDTGSFDNLELIINDDYDLSYPEEWTKYEIVISGAGSEPTEMNFAFRYNVDNSSAMESNFIGIDTVKIESDEENGEDEACEWTVKVWSYETFGDEITWELRNAEGVILSGGPYDVTFTDEQSVTAEGPVEFYINTIGTTNDNEADFKISNESGVLLSGHADAGEEETYSDMNCEDEGVPEEEDEYCQPYLDCTGNDMITNVTFLEIDNDSECSPEGYGDYTDQVANVIAGETYPISVSVGDGWDVESVSVWIDFDQSGTFDEEEFFYIGTGSDEVLTSEISIPEGLEQDEYRMRVRVAAVGEAEATWDMSCDTDEQFFGESEDYTLSVGEGDDPVEGDPCEWTVKVWSYETFGEEVTWELRNAEGVILSGGPYDLMFTDEQSVTAEGPVEFYINTIGALNDNEADFKISNESGVLISGHIDGGEEATYSDMNCEDEGEPEEEDEYCQPYLDCTGNDMITNVTFLEIDNDSDCSPEGYGDYTDQIANVVAGETYPISVTVGDGWDVESVSVWIDFDQSGTFDEDEFFYIGTGSDEVLTSEISIPEGLEQDEYRMRVRVAAVGEAEATWDMSCDTDEQFFGESEDYTVSVGEMGVSNADKIDFTFYPNPVSHVLNIQSDKEIESATVYNILGQKVIQSKMKNTQIGVESLSPGIYMVELQFTEGKKEMFRIIKK